MAAILLACGAGISPNVVDPDLWGHVQYGRDVLEDGLPLTTSYSYSAVGHPWINHENLSEILLAVGADSIGPRGLLVAKFLLGMLILGVVMRKGMRDGAAMLTVCAVSLLVAISLAHHWSLRPQLSSYACFTILLLLLSYAFHGWEGAWHLRRGAPRPERLPYASERMRALWLAPVLFLFWANAHGGFVAGYAIFAVYLAARCVEAFCLIGRQAWGLVRRLLLMATVSALATLVNPYGPRLHLWLLESLTVPRPEITEWHPPNWLSLEAVPLALLLASALVVLWQSRRSRDFTHLVVMGVALWQAVEHQRHVPFFAIPFGLWMMVHVDSCLRRWNWVSDPDAPQPPIPRRAALALVPCMLVCFSVLGWRAYDRLHDLPVERDTYPVSALQFIADHGLNGRMVVTYNWAQYVIGAFGDRDGDGRGIRVGFDGRFRTCYPQEIVDMHFDFVLGWEPPIDRYRLASGPPPRAERALEFGRPDLALVSRLQPHSVRTLEAQNDWVLLYQDELAQVWGRASRFDDRQSPDYLDPSERDISDATQEGTVMWPAYPRSPERPVSKDRRIVAGPRVRIPAPAVGP